MQNVFLLLALCGLSLVSGCQSALMIAPTSAGLTDTQSVDTDPLITVTTAPLVMGNCSGQFVEHTLDHITTVASSPVEMFDSNGAGLAINDLDNDGSLDIVMANLKGNNAIFWNHGSLDFRKDMLDHGQSRAVATVDVDGDGLLDVVFTQRIGSLAFWRNDGNRAFSQQRLPGVQEYAYAMNWADLDQDGDLDVVTASYDAGLEKDLGSGFLLSSGAGVFAFENRAGTFIPTQLAEKSQALAIHLGDLNGDQQTDILVGNDFSVYDGVWYQAEEGWVPSQPFSTTTHSTMSYAVGDINNDGITELFATDMKPYLDDEATRNAWAPVMAMMPHHTVEDDPQIMENVLQVQNASADFENLAPSFGLAATGWSWSAKFGDLDNNGFLDLYVVNGMVAAELFAHLPSGALVEHNQALRNQKGTQFVSVPEWRLDTETSGRGMSMADLDNDGDLDIVVNNLQAPAQIFENQLCSGATLQVDLRWPESDNTHAVGAELFLETSMGPMIRQVHSISGYLSGDPARIHFGFPEDTVLHKLRIRWPDDTISRLAAPPSNSRIEIHRSKQK